MRTQMMQIPCRPTEIIIDLDIMGLPAHVRAALEEKASRIGSTIADVWKEAALSFTAETLQRTRQTEIKHTVLACQRRLPKRSAGTEKRKLGELERLDRARSKSVRGNHQLDSVMNERFQSNPKRKKAHEISR